MLDTLINLVKDFMEPLTSLGKAVVMAVAVVFALLALVISIVQFFKRRIGTAFLFLGIAIIIGVVASIGFAATKRLGKGIGSDLQEGINMLPMLALAPAGKVGRDPVPVQDLTQHRLIPRQVRAHQGHIPVPASGLGPAANLRRRKDALLAYRLQTNRPGA